MSTLVTTTSMPATTRRRIAGMHPASWAILLGSFVILAIVRLVSNTDSLTAADTIRAAIESTCPILLAGIGGLWAERAGVVNIGLEGQMLLGTWGAAYFNWYYGPWTGLLGGIVLGMLGGLLHALATVTFRVDQIVSGVAVNIIGLGAVTFLAKAFFGDIHPNGGPRNLSGLDPLPTGGWSWLADHLDDLAAKHWFLVSDLAGIVGGLVGDISIVSVIVLLLVIATAVLLWRTSFGLRLRSCGENPSAAESLGVNVYVYKYVAVLVSGGLAGLGGAYLSTVSSSTFTVNQTAGRGYIGLAAMIFGNWRPGGTLGASFLFGYTDSLTVRNPAALHSLLLLAAIGLLAFAAWRVARRSYRAALGLGALGIAFLVWYLVTNSVPSDLGGMAPYVVTLLVLALASQRLRMPAADGLPYRKGSAG